MTKSTRTTRAYSSARRSFPLLACAVAAVLVGVSALAVGQSSSARAPGAPRASNTHPAVVRIAGGTFQPFFAEPNAPPVQVAPFWIDARPVTNAQYARFVAANPNWAPTKPPVIFASPLYLRGWGERSPQAIEQDAALNQRPVTFVSWFSSSAYCEAQGGRLPSEAEWEFVGLASEHAFDASKDVEHTRRILAWYERVRQPELEPVGSHPPNAWGVYDMHGLVWEWVSDFNASMTGGARRGSTEQVVGLFCGGAAANARTPDDYAAFMRYAFRSSLHGAYVMHSLGFRCAYDHEVP